MPAIPYHCSMNVHSRAKGHSATAAAAYRSATVVPDVRTGTVHDYTRKAGIEHAEIVLPEGAPEWASDRAELWNAAELAERNKDGSDRMKACICREMKLAFPAQLDFEVRRDMVRELAEEISQRHQVPVDFAMHEPDREGDHRNYHAHVMFSVRRLEVEGFTDKTRELDDRAQGPKLVKSYRERWAELCADRLLQQGDNTEAERWRYGHMTKQQQADKALERGDREYARDVLREGPQVHQGPSVTAMERKGIETEVGAMNRAVREDGIRFDQERAETATKIEENPAIILEKITQTKAVFDRRDIARELNRYIDDADQFQTLMARLENVPGLVQLAPETRDGRRTIPAKLTTGEMIETERAMMASAERLAGTQTHAVKADTVAAVTGRHDTLSDEQRAAVEHVTGAGRLAVVIGDAGTGKSFGMGVAKEAWEAAGYRVRGCALAGKAADELQAGSGIESRTIHALEHAWERGKDPLTRRDVLVIDEAGMVGSRQLSRVLAAAEKAGAKVVMLGDDKQLAAIEAGAGFRAIAERVGVAEITQIRRQSDAWARQASTELARGKVRVGLDAYHERGHVRMLDDREAAKAALAADYLADQEKDGSSIILAHTNADVASLNSTIREARQDAGELDQVAEFMTERGRREFAAGDRLVFLKNDADLAVKNGTLGTVEQAEDGHLAVRLDDGREVAFSAEQFAHVDHGYAVTIHKAQGVTVDRAYVLASGGMDRSLAYVAMTRHRDTAALYAGADDFTDRRAGRLVEHGPAPYEHDSENSDSYFVTLENDAGKRHTVWGVDIGRAIAESGAQVGDKIGLEHVGSEPVQLPDGQIAERHQWQVRSSGEMAYDKLAERLGRQRPKASTLDFAESAYGFADRRDYDGAGVVRRWIERGRDRLEQLADRAEKALSSVLERAGIHRDVPSMEQASPEDIEALRQPQEPPARGGFLPRQYSDEDLIGEPRTPEKPADELTAEAKALARIRAARAQERGEPEQVAQVPADRQQQVLGQLRGDLAKAQQAGDELTAVQAAGKLAKAEELAEAGEPLTHHGAAIQQAGKAALDEWAKQQRSAEHQAQPKDALTPEAAEALEQIQKARSRERGERQRGRRRDGGHEL